MAPKRKAAAPPADAQEQEQEDATTTADAPNGPPPNRRQAQAAAARRRAAHFAHFGDEQAAAEEDNVHVGANNARNLGPWSSAVELVNARQAAIDERNSKLQQQAEQQEEEVAWQPGRDPALGPRPSNAVPSLFSLSVQLLVQHIAAVSSLWGVPDSIRSQLAAAVCAQRKLSPEVALLFGHDTPTELVIPDCTQLDAKAMAGLLELLLQGRLAAAADDASRENGSSPNAPAAAAQAAAAEAGLAAHQQYEPPQQQQPAAAPAPGAARLERLELGACGHGFDDRAAAVVAAAGPLQGLRVLRLTGAYRLTDTGLLQLLRAAPQLQELAVPSAPRLTGEFLSQLPQLAPHLTSLDLSGCGGLSGDDLSLLLAQMQGLQRLMLDGIEEVDAKVLSAASKAAGLQSLSLAFCRHVDDAALAALAAAAAGSGSGSSGSSSCGSLRELVLDDCTAISDAGLLSLLDGPDGCRSLQRLSVAHCSKLTDASLVPLAERGVLERLCINSLHMVGPATLQALARSCGETLQELDVSFCRGITEGAVGQLVDRCSNLEQLSVYSCTQLSRKFLHGHSNDKVVVLGVPTSCS